MNKKVLTVAALIFTGSILYSLFNLITAQAVITATYIIDFLLKVVFLALIVKFLLDMRSQEKLFAKADLYKAKVQTEPTAKPIPTPITTFADVAGLAEVKEELYEIVDFLKNPQVYKDMGAQLPRGMLFYGPPGTGKTLLAKALAGEGKASFHYVCGSEFVEKYVGVGAKRVRALFEKAKHVSPSIIFIDEIDAVGAKRSSDGNNEKEQTLNQLLVEMDGFATDNNVIIVGATNRLDLLDEALLRPGRFDRQIYIGSPDLAAREQILNVHFKNKPLDVAVTMKSIAKRTVGMTGAHLASIANESALLAVRAGRQVITVLEVEKAIEKSLAGLERKGALITDEEKQKIAIHEAGHALMVKFFTNDGVDKISIIPRGQALGYTLQIPEESKMLITKDELLSKIKVFLGGRAAEMLIYNQLSSGARDDIKKATGIAKEMICELGMGDFGHITLDEKHSYFMSQKINAQVRALIDSCYQEALSVITTHKAILLSLSDALIKNETLSEGQIDEILISCGFNASPCLENKIGA